MRNRGDLLLVIAGIAAAFAFTGAPACAQQPTTNARPLHEWVEIAASPRNTPDYLMAKQVLEGLGTNAIPSLLKWMAYEPKPSEPNLVPFPFSLTAHGDPRQFALAEAAADAFRVLGPTATPALPQLASMAAGQNARAIKAMGHIGPAALPYLLAILTNGPARVRYTATYAILDLGTNARPAIPALIRSLTDPETRHDTLKVLTYLGGSLDLDTEIIIPGITNLARDPAMRARAIDALGCFRNQAETVMPSLRAALKDPDKHVRMSARDAIQYIAPGTLTAADIYEEPSAPPQPTAPFLDWADPHS